MFNFLNLKSNAFGLDISDYSIKVLKLKAKRRGFELAYFDEFFLEPGIVKEGNILKEKALVDALQKMLTKAKGKLKTKDVVASLPEEKAFVQVIQMPKMELSQIRKAVYFEAEKYIPVPKDEVYLDFQVVEPIVDSLDHLDILISALPKDVVDPYFSVLEKAGLNPVCFEIESQAVTRAVVKDEKIDSRVFIIELGGNKTRFVVFAGHSLRFISSSMVCGSTFDRAIAKEFEVSTKAARELKKRFGLDKDIVIRFKNGEGVKKEVAGGVFDALIPPLTDLIEQIERCESFYLTHASHEHLSVDKRTIDKILLCGGGASMKGLPAFLEEHLWTTVERADPWVNIIPDPSKRSPKMSRDQSLKYTTALGLALRGVREEQEEGF